MPTTQVNGSATAGATSLVLALAVWLVILAPQWALLLYAARSLARIREAVARSFWLKLLAAGFWTGAVGLAMIGTVEVCRNLLGPERLGVQYIVAYATLVHEGLLIVAVILVAKTHRAGASAPAPVVHKRPSPRAIAVVLLACVAAAVVLVALALGPFAEPSAAVHVWRALTIALLAIPVLTVLLASAVRKERKRRL